MDIFPTGYLCVHRTAQKAEHAVDLETGEIVGVAARYPILSCAASTGTALPAGCFHDAPI